MADFGCHLSKESTGSCCILINEVTVESILMMNCIYFSPLQVMSYSMLVQPPVLIRACTHMLAHFLAEPISEVDISVLIERINSDSLEEH